MSLELDQDAIRDGYCTCTFLLGGFCVITLDIVDDDTAQLFDDDTKHSEDTSCSMLLV